MEPHISQYQARGIGDYRQPEIPREQDRQNIEISSVLSPSIQESVGTETLALKGHKADELDVLIPGLSTSVSHSPQLSTAVASTMDHVFRMSDTQKQQIATIAKLIPPQDLTDAVMEKLIFLPSKMLNILAAIPPDKIASLINIASNSTPQQLDNLIAQTMSFRELLIKNSPDDQSYGFAVIMQIIAAVPEEKRTEAFLVNLKKVVVYNSNKSSLSNLDSFTKIPANRVMGQTQLIADKYRIYDKIGDENLPRLKSIVDGLPMSAIPILVTAVPKEKIVDVLKMLHKLPKDQIQNLIDLAKSTKELAVDQKDNNKKGYIFACIMQIIGSTPEAQRTQQFVNNLTLFLSKDKANLFTKLDALTNTPNLLSKIPSAMVANELLDKLSGLPTEIYSVLSDVHPDKIVDFINAFASIPQKRIIDSIRLSSTLCASISNQLRFDRSLGETKALAIQIIAQSQEQDEIARDLTSIIREGVLNNNQSPKELLEQISRISPESLETTLAQTAREVERGLRGSHNISFYIENGSAPSTAYVSTTNADITYYELTLSRDELKKNPINVLHKLCGQFEKEVRDRLYISFESKIASAASGSSREFVSELFQGVINETKSENMEFIFGKNGLSRPELLMVKNQFQDLSEEQKTNLRMLGQLMMFCINVDESEPYPSGVHFDVSFFTGIKGLMELDNLQELSKGNLNYSPETFSKFFSIYIDMNKNNENELRRISQLEELLKPLTEDTSEAILKQAYGGSWGVLDDDLFDLIGGDIKKIRDHFTDIQNALRKQIFNDSIRPVLAPLLEIAVGMKEARFTKVPSGSIQEMNAIQFSEKLQGQRISAYVIKEKLKYDPGTPNFIKEQLEEWIDKADESKLKKFIFAFSNSTALGKQAEIQVKPGRFIEFHTCSNRINLNFSLSFYKDLGENDSDGVLDPKAAFIKKFELIIEEVYKEKGFGLKEFGL